MSGALNFNNITGLNNYADSESSTTTFDQAIVAKFITESQGFTTAEKQEIILLLERIKVIILDNKSSIDEMSDNVIIAKGLLQEQIDELKSDNTLNDLYEFNGIDKTVLSIASSQFNTFFSRIQELSYRQNILNYQSTFLQQQKNLMNVDIELINKYIIALQG